MSEKKKKPERKKIPHRTQTKPWVDPQDTEKAAGEKLPNSNKKKNIKTPDNFSYGDMPADFRRRYDEHIRGI